MRGDRKQVLVKVGRDLFSRYGYKDVAIGDIARAAGVGTGSFYTYFASKEDFYGEILDELEAEGRREVDRLLKAFSTSLGKLKALFRFASLGVRRNPILLGALTGDRKYIYPSLALREQRGESLRHYIEARFRDVLNDGARSLELPVGQYRNPHRLALALFDAILLHLDSPAIEELLDDALRLLERGMGRLLRLRGGRDRREQRRLVTTGTELPAIGRPRPAERPHSPTRDS